MSDLLGTLENFLTSRLMWHIKQSGDKVSPLPSYSVLTAFPLQTKTMQDLSDKLGIGEEGGGGGGVRDRHLPSYFLFLQHVPFQI